MKPTIFDAVHSLVGGGMSGDSDVFESIDYKEGQTPPSKEEAENKLTELIAEYDALQYQRDRYYPTIGNQLDMQYWDQVNGTTTWKDAIAKVKSDNPKK